VSSFKTRSLTGVAAGMFLCLTMASANAGPAPGAAALALSDGGSVRALVDDVQFRGPRGVRGPRVVAGPRVYGGGRRFGGRGAAVGAGIAAGVLGAVIGSAIMAQQPAYAAPAPVYGAPAYGGGSVEWCMRRYRSYSPETGTYIGYDGIERPCP